MHDELTDSDYSDSDDQGLENAESVVVINVDDGEIVRPKTAAICMLHVDILVAAEIPLGNGLLLRLQNRPFRSKAPPVMNED